MSRKSDTSDVAKKIVIPKPSPETLPMDPTEDIHPKAADMSANEEKIVTPPLTMSWPEPLPLMPAENTPPLQIHMHAPGHYCFYCPCDGCRGFFGRGKPVQQVEPRSMEIPPPPRYSYMLLVNHLRAASARREEKRQDRIRAARQEAAGERAPKKDKASKLSKKKKLGQTLKRRRQ